MAVSVNTVYQTVLYILNKEQRGYVTPAEFNSLAAQVQDEIFNSYFPDGNQLNRQNQNNTQNNTEFFNMFEDISYKVASFIQEVELSIVVVSQGNEFFNYPSSQLYKIGEVISTYTGQPAYSSVTQLVSKAEYSKIERSKLTKPTNQYPIYYYQKSSSSGSNLLKISPTPNTVTANVILKPLNPNWGFVTGSLNQYIYNAGTSQDFELDVSEQSNIVIKILKYCGVIVNDPTVIQIAEQEAKEVEINDKS
tara:strand:+ start:913 stop:1662 length:750 start_codon:yes stop_codon:yes gene_type:complete